jgi:ADP-ribosyl-[dinitrogen reductase] hydrolase
MAGSDERREDRIAGALVGLAAGDALGAGYEFGPPVTSRIEMKGGGHFGWEPGEFTDDTQMAICIAESSTHGSIDLDQVGDRFIAWAKDARDVGSQTRDVLSRAETGAELPAISRERFERLPQRSAGNGSLMRTGAVALAFHDDIEGAVAAARDVSDLTHGDPQCADACVLWTAGIVTAIDTGALPDLRDGLEWLPAERRDMWRANIDRAEAEGPNTFYPNGYVLLAFQAAWSAITHTMPGPQHYRDGVTRAVSIGNDTDTVAAIAGTMLGAAYGISSIPTEWLDVLHGWPGYRTDDLTALARRVAGLAG